MSKVDRRARIAAVCASMLLLLAACGSDGVEQAQVDSVPPTPIPTTPPLAVPTVTPTPVPTPTSVPLPQATSTPIPTAIPTPLPTSTVAPAPAADPDPSPTTASEAAPVATAVATAAPAVVETPTPVPTATAAQPVADEGASTEPTAVVEAPTAVVAATGEAPLECYDRDVKVYRAHVDGVDDLSFEGGRVYCSGAGTNAVSAAQSYRHSTGLIVQRNNDFILNDAGSGYIPYSGFVHFCMNGQPASAPVVADTVPSLLVVIDAEAQRQVAQGATAPAAFGGSGTQC